nr:hypothetical protein BaRGS_023871 [Batillaria attramentaria]
MRSSSKDELWKALNVSLLIPTEVQVAEVGEMGLGEVLENEQLVVNGMAFVYTNSVPIGIFLALICVPGTAANLTTLFLMVRLKLARKNIPQFLTCILAIAYFLSFKRDVPVGLKMSSVVILTAKSTFDPIVHLSMTSVLRGRVLEILKCGACPKFWQLTPKDKEDGNVPAVEQNGVQSSG